MTTEDDFQKQLDLDPLDFQTKLIFADWLDERGDPRGPGYRAMGVNQRCAAFYTLKNILSAVPIGSECPFWIRGLPNSNLWNGDKRVLPSDWFDLLVVKGKRDNYAPVWTLNAGATRRELEDAAALAFALLPEARRDQLLKGPAYDD